MGRTIRIGTRGSKLAMWQAHFIADLLKQAGQEIEIVKIDTKGDKILDVTISKIGSKGVFTEEIEEQLANGSIDIAIHSAKDMQSHLPEGFELIAFTKREKVNDVLVSYKKLDLTEPLTLGTASTRRVAMLKRSFPHIKTVAVRGNLQTRYRKMQEGVCDALLLAYAGVHRMQMDDSIKHTFSENHFVPAVGQGSVAIEVHETLDEDIKNIVRKCSNHYETEVQLLAERSFLRKMNGGCSIPVFGLATLTKSTITLTGGIISLNGFKLIKHSVEGNIEEPEALGNKLANIVLDGGGAEILNEINQLK